MACAVDVRKVGWILDSDLAGAIGCFYTQPLTPPHVLRSLATCPSAKEGATSMTRRRASGMRRSSMHPGGDSLAVKTGQHMGGAGPRTPQHTLPRLPFDPRSSRLIRGIRSAGSTIVTVAVAVLSYGAHQ